MCSLILERPTAKICRNFCRPLTNVLKSSAQRDYSSTHNRKSRNSEAKTEGDWLRQAEKRKMEAELAELERVQTLILQRISNLELSSFPQNSLSASSSVRSSDANCSQIADGDDIEARLSAILRSNGVRDFSFKRVPSDYYDWSLEARRDSLGAASVDHLCKSIVLVRHLTAIRQFNMFSISILLKCEIWLKTGLEFHMPN